MTELDAFSRQPFDACRTTNNAALCKSDSSAVTRMPRINSLGPTFGMLRANVVRMSTTNPFRTVQTSSLIDLKIRTHSI
jgi:hypothetical protein